MSDHHESNGSPDCCSQSVDEHQIAEWSRRSFLRRSLGALMGMTVAGPVLSLIDTPLGSGLTGLNAQMLSGEDFPLTSPSPINSVVVLWMNGGASQLDTFDPKPGNRNGGPFAAIETAAKGVKISEHLPQVATLMDRIALVRCMETKEGNHQRARYLMRTGFKPNPTVEYPGLGALLSYEQDVAYSDLPQNISINIAGETAGVFGLPYDSFDVNNPSRPVDNLAATRGMTDDRLERRMRLLKQSDKRFRENLMGEEYLVDGHHGVIQDALKLMSSKDKVAFDLSEESDAVKEKYGNSKFGQGCLMARRLVEAGVKYVEVSQNGWDTHEDNFTQTKKLMGELDGGMASLIKDLEERDLLKSTLVVWMGEFGRTPEINNREGRDHFPSGWTVAMAGANIKGGTVIGETSADGSKIIGQSITTGDLYRTILWCAGINSDTEYVTPKGRPVTYADAGNIIKPLIKMG